MLVRWARCGEGCGQEEHIVSVRPNKRAETTSMLYIFTNNLSGNAFQRFGKLIGV